MNCAINLLIIKRNDITSWPIKGSCWQRCSKCTLLTHVNWYDKDDEEKDQ